MLYHDISCKFKIYVNPNANNSFFLKHKNGTLYHDT